MEVEKKIGIFNESLLKIENCPNRIRRFHLIKDLSEEIDIPVEILEQELLRREKTDKKEMKWRAKRRKKTRARE